MSKLRHYSDTVLRTLFGLILVAVFVFQPVIARADGLSNGDIQALNDFPNWVASTCGGTSALAPGTLPKIIPEPYNGAFTAGANAHKVAPALVAAIFTEENFTHTPFSQLAATWANFLKIHKNPDSGWPTSTAGATGPFQFLPSTWTGLGYNIGDIDNLAKAADAAAKYLASNGATNDKPPTSWDNAIFAYNHAQWYVNAVLQYYNFYSNGSTKTNPIASTILQNTCGAGIGVINCKGVKPAGTGGLSNFRQTAVCIAKEELALWKSGKMRVGFRPCSAGNPSGCTSFAKYSQNSDELWCADFVSWAYNQAGYPIGSGGAWRVPAVATIASIGQKQQKWHYHPVNSYQPRPGDLAIHNGSDHVNMVVAITPTKNLLTKGVPTLIGGDEVGPNFPDGSVVAQDQFVNDVTGYVSPD